MIFPEISEPGKLTLEEIELFNFLCEKIMIPHLKQKKYLSVRETAQFLGESINTVSSWSTGSKKHPYLERYTIDLTLHKSKHGVMFDRAELEILKARADMFEKGAYDPKAKEKVWAAKKALLKLKKYKVERDRVMNSSGNIT